MTTFAEAHAAAQTGEDAVYTLYFTKRELRAALNVARLDGSPPQADKQAAAALFERMAKRMGAVD
ncbi:hypothetical protein G6W57_00600 [Streptomyces sp. CAI-121]|uniref:hypothetical protein n=1 Tax=unclassified Streptomyces TaxID=2593676 RepID=UPI001587B1CB|nr:MULTISPECIES: hypothetical protein [unclassified Streptomyces]NUV65615.1 hypothetical protein [Streptomyces sp. CAI-121]NUW12352.1 hypothetical protein [Streptomyces sp. CAI-68]